MSTRTKTRIMVFGTFDVLHKGHMSFFRQARRLARQPYLIVSVARDVNVKKIKKSLPLNHEVRRKQRISRLGIVDKAVLGGIKNYLPHILKERPQIIALGYDQKNYVKGLKQKLAKKALLVKVVKLKAYWPYLFKSSLIKGRKSVKKN